MRPFGELCHFELGPLRSAFDAAADCAANEIRVDLAEVTLLSSAAVTFLEEAAKECEKLNLRFALVNVSGLNRKVIEVLGLGCLINERA